MRIFKWDISVGDDVYDKRTGEKVGRVKNFDSDGSRARVSSGGVLRGFFAGNLTRDPNNKDGK